MMATCLVSQKLILGPVRRESASLLPGVDVRTVLDTHILLQALDKAPKFLLAGRIRDHLSVSRHVFNQIFVEHLNYGDKNCQLTSN